MVVVWCFVFVLNALGTGLSNNLLEAFFRACYLPTTYSASASTPSSAAAASAAVGAAAPLLSPSADSGSAQLHVQHHSAHSNGVHVLQLPVTASASTTTTTTSHLTESAPLLPVPPTSHLPPVVVPAAAAAASAAATNLGLASPSSPASDARPMRGGYNMLDFVFAMNGVMCVWSIVSLVPLFSVAALAYGSDVGQQVFGDWSALSSNAQWYVFGMGACAWAYRY